MNASSATAARRCVSIRLVAAVTLRLPGRAARQEVLERATRSAGSRCRPRRAPCGRAAPTAAARAHGGVGQRDRAAVGGAGERLVGADRDERPATCGSRRPRWPRTRPRRRSPRPSAAANRAWRCSIADCGWSVTSASLRASVPTRATTFADTRHSESPTWSSPRQTSGSRSVGREPAVLVRVGQGRQAGLADQVGLGRADGRDVHLAAADDGDRDADRARRRRRGPGRTGRAGGRAACWRCPGP